VEALLPKARLLVEPALYDAMPEDILALIDGHATAETLMVIGHNPGLQEAAVTLLSEAPASVRDADLIAAGFPTATVAILDMSGPAGPSLVALFNPRRAPPPFVEAWDDSEGEGH
jgi:phosphohistidine phosphatase